MAPEKTDKHCDIGIIGLGVMGANLALNMADHGFSVAGYDQDVTKVNALAEQNNSSIKSSSELKDFLNSISKPRAVLLLVPAGPIVDAVVNELLPLLEPKDIIIDAGNSFFKDTDKRSDQLKQKDIFFLGVGVSGGEMGARLGPSIMPGGPKEAYERVKNIFEAIAAKVDKQPCVAYLGPQSAGHYVKMVHNGIEYGVMQLIAETYDLMKRGLGYDNEQLQAVYSKWNQGKLNSYLLEITSQIFTKKDDLTGSGLIDEISDVARQKGTGAWTTESAMELQIPAPTIDSAVTMRDLSVFKEEREALSKIYQAPKSVKIKVDDHQLITHLAHALYMAINIVYIQGFSLLQCASDKYNYQLNLETVATIWRGGCIIRAALLDEIKRQFKSNPSLKNLMLAPDLAKNLNENQQSLRDIIKIAVDFGIPTPGLMTSLAYFDAFRSAKLPSNLIQAQRDYFGSHTYERIDREGTFHTIWEKAPK